MREPACAASDGASRPPARRRMRARPPPARRSQPPCARVAACRRALSPWRETAASGVPLGWARKKHSAREPLPVLRAAHSRSHKRTTPGPKTHTPSLRHERPKLERRALDEPKGERGGRGAEGDGEWGQGRGREVEGGWKGQGCRGCEAGPRRRGRGRRRWRRRGRRRRGRGVVRLAAGRGGAGVSAARRGGRRRREGGGKGGGKGRGSVRDLATR